MGLIEVRGSFGVDSDASSAGEYLAFRNNIDTDLLYR